MPGHFQVHHHIVNKGEGNEKKHVCKFSNLGSNSYSGRKYATGFTKH